jgi:non-ribosomal peptide synthase protein (TIGR01720 family)
VSWRFLLEDLALLCEQVRTGAPLSLPAKTSSFKAWADRLRAHAQSAEMEAEEAFWQSLDLQHGMLPLPAGLDISVAGAATLTTSLDAEATRALLHDVPGVYRTQINDALLTALVEAFAGLTGSRTLLIELEGHGREELFPELDISRTAGWFTALFPVQLDLQGISDIGDSLKAVKEQLRRIPNRGIGYSILRHLRADSATARQPRPHVSFNYLGQMGSSGAGLYPAATQPTGAPRSPKNRRPNLIEIVGRVSNDRLTMDWIYPAQADPRILQDTANAFNANLKRIIDHCQNSEGGFTLSDFLLLDA